MDSAFRWHRFEEHGDKGRLSICEPAVPCFYPQAHRPLLLTISPQHAPENGGDHCPQCCPEKFNYALDAQHLADVRAAQDGLGREGWASTDPGRTKYHHYNAAGQSKCSYQKQHGPLHFADDPGRLTTAECCTACDLHLLKASQHAEPAPLPAAPHQSAWQKKQYPTPTPITQLSLF